VSQHLTPPGMTTTKRHTKTSVGESMGKPTCSCIAGGIVKQQRHFGTQFGSLAALQNVTHEGVPWP
jgi:hypothetical protein